MVDPIAVDQVIEIDTVFPVDDKRKICVGDVQFVRQIPEGVAMLQVGLGCF
jgi:hypothetical protein